MCNVNVNAGIRKAERALIKSIQTYYTGETSLDKVEKKAIKLYSLKLIKKFSKNAKQKN